MIVVHPNEIIRLQKGRQRLGEVLIDAPVAINRLRVDPAQIEPVVKARPKHVV